MGLVGESELTAAYHSLIGGITTRDREHITWQEFMSFLLHVKLDSGVNTVTKKDEHDEHDKTPMVIPSTNKGKRTIKRKKTGEKTNIKPRPQQGQGHDHQMTGPAVAKGKKHTNNVTAKAHHQSAVTMATKGNPVHHRNTCNGSRRSGANGVHNSDKNTTTAAVPTAVPASVPVSVPVPASVPAAKKKKAFTPRSYVIGSRMNSGKLGGRHLQLHVFPNGE
jgi:hypothetical protein